MLERKIEILVTSVCFTLLLFASVIGWSLFFFLFITRFWWLNIIYFIWYFADKDTPVTGGRQLSWWLNAKIWNYYKNYFSSKLILESGFTLDPKRNYLFCSFPHGILPLGPFVNLSIRSGLFRQLYYNFKVHYAVLHCLFYTPFLREYGLSVGLVSCSEVGLNYLLSKPGGGNIVTLFPGGALEAYYYQPGQYKFVVKKRKGFVRVALKNGAPLVPVITFGENDLFQRVEIKKMMDLQQFIRKTVGFMPMLFYGRGFRENWYGWFPLRKPLTTIVGKPIDVVKIENPSMEQIEELHGIFVEELKKLFDTHKYKVLKNPDSVNLVLE